MGQCQCHNPPLSWAYKRCICVLCKRPAVLHMYRKCRQSLPTAACNMPSVQCAASICCFMMRADGALRTTKHNAWPRSGGFGGSHSNKCHCHITAVVLAVRCGCDTAAVDLRHKHTQRTPPAHALLATLCALIPLKRHALMLIANVPTCIQHDRSKHTPAHTAARLRAPSKNRTTPYATRHTTLLCISAASRPVF